MSTYVPFPREALDRENRWRRVWSAMDDDGYGALIVGGRGIISQYGYVEYLTGYTSLIRRSYAVIAQSQPPILVLPTAADAWYAHQAGVLETCVAGEGDVSRESDSMVDAVAAKVISAGAGRGRVGIIGLDSIISAGDYEKLRIQLGDARLDDATALLAKIKAVKDEAEIHHLVATAAIADAGFDVFRQRAASGRTPQEIFGEIEYQVRRRGAREVLIFISAGPYFGARPGSEPLRDGDLVTVYVELAGPSGYWVERGGLFMLGNVDDERQRLARACLAAMRAAAAAIHPGTAACEIAAIIDDHAAAAGAKSGLWHGHGVGVDHDLPTIGSSDTTPLVEGMAIALHPNFADQAERIGASVCDTFVVTQDGSRRLSAIPQKIHQIAA